MNVAQMMTRKNGESDGMSLQSVQDGFRRLTEKQVYEAVEIARRQGISEAQINEGLRMIRGLKQ